MLQWKELETQPGSRFCAGLSAIDHAPGSQAPAGDALAAWLREHAADVDARLTQHGVLLLRGFVLPTAQDFEHVALALDAALQKAPWARARASIAGKWQPALSGARSPSAPLPAEAAPASTTRPLTSAVVGPDTGAPDSAPQWAETHIRRHLSLTLPVRITARSLPDAFDS